MFRLDPLKGGFGAMVSGIDLRTSPSSHTERLLRSALLDHSFLIFKRQVLSDTEHVAAAGIFGSVHCERDAAQNARPRLRYVSNVKLDGQIAILPKGDLQFHSDYCFEEAPYSATTLNAIQVPQTGGDTLFADAISACKELPEALRLLLSKHRAINSYDGTRTRRYDASTAAERCCSQPCIVAHPGSARPVLYVNRLMTTAIEDLPAAVSADVLEQAFAHIEQDKFIYPHKWEAGDFVIWDNIAVQHARSDFAVTEPRILRRLAIDGVRLVAA